MTVEIRAFIREANHNKMSGHGFERHTPVLELGLRGATHALRVLSSKSIPATREIFPGTGAVTNAKQRTARQSSIGTAPW